MVDELERSGRREVAPRYTDPVGTLRSEMDRLFDTFLGGALPTFPSLFGPGVGRGATLMPRMDVRETDKEIIIEAELPGLEEKDISLTLQNGILTVGGEKKSRYDEEKENYRVMERSYGSFQRSLRVPDTVDEDKVAAHFENGILKVTLPKRPELVGSPRKIEIKKT
jgi:HSP20 family protein